MNYNVVALPKFSTQLKKLAKKYKKIKIDLQQVIKELKENPKIGIALQHNCYKIRVANSSVPIGKSGGFRIIYYFLDENNNIYLMSIYSKTQKESISENEIVEILKTNGLTQ